MHCIFEVLEVTVIKSIFLPDINYIIWKTMNFSGCQDYIQKGEPIIKDKLNQ